MATHSMKERLDDLEHRRNEALHPAPERTVQRQREKGKMLARERIGPANAYDITFPQGIMWGIIGCVMSFAIGRGMMTASP